MEKLDYLLAKKLFHPPIIRWCQWRKCTQHTFANYLWVVAIVSLLATTPATLMGWVIYAVTVFALIYCVQRVALNPDQESRGMGTGVFGASFRVIAFGFCVFTLLDLVVGDGLKFNDAYFWAFSFAEYARTIKTIPPLETKQASGVPVKARV